LKLTTDRHATSRGLSATAELLSKTLTQRLLELVEDVGKQLSLGGVLRVLPDTVEHHRDFGASLHRRDEQIGQL